MSESHTSEQLCRAAGLLQQIVDCLNDAALELRLDEWAANQQLVIPIPEARSTPPQLRRIAALLLDR